MPKIVDHAHRRREIVFGLWAVIYERGIAGVTFRAVAAAAGVSVGRIQHYFASKHDLVLEGARGIVAMSTEAWAAAPDHASARLSALARQPVPRTEAFRLGVAVWYAYLAAATADTELSTIIRDAVRDGYDTATRLAADLTGHDPSGTARAAAVRLVALGAGLAQAVLAGALDAEEALTVLDAELAQLPSPDTEAGTKGAT